MRTAIPQLEMVAPATLDAALGLVEQGWTPFAGGTDLMVMLDAGKLTSHRFAGLWNLPELHGIHPAHGGISIGALATYTEIRRSPIVQAQFPLLDQSAAVTGSIAIQNRGTLGGNIANASPAGDSLPVLLVYDAQLELISRRGTRRVPYSSFHRAYKQLDLHPGEIIARILLPPMAGWQQRFRKVGTRAAQAISKIAMAAAAKVEHGRIVDFRLAYASAAPVPLRCFQVEETLRGARLDALPVIPDETSPIDDIRSTAHYRRTVARNLLLRFLADLE